LNVAGIDKLIAERLDVILPQKLAEFKERGSACDA